MAVRRFGPTLGAGVQLTEKDPEKQIQAAPLGVTSFIAQFEKGTVGEPGFPSGKKSFELRYGKRIPTSEGPASAQDFYRLGRSSGELRHRP